VQRKQQIFARRQRFGSRPPLLMACKSRLLTMHPLLAGAALIADASLLVTIDFIRLPLVVALGFALFGEAVSPAVLVGGSIILVAFVLLLNRERNGVTRGPICEEGRCRGLAAAKVRYAGSRFLLDVEFVMCRTSVTGFARKAEARYSAAPCVARALLYS
jgi:hypothetical protein